MDILEAVMDRSDSVNMGEVAPSYTTMLTLPKLYNCNDSQSFFSPTSDTASVGDDRVFAPFVYGTLVPILYGLVSVVGIAGNSLVVYVILTRDRMRTVTNLLLLNLAFADLSFVLVIPPVTAYVMKSPTQGWPLGDAECRLMHYLVNVTAYVTVYTLVLISVIRYMTIVHSARTVAIRTTANVVRMIVAIWIVMLAVNSPVLVSYGARPYAEEDGGHAATVDPCINEETDVARGTTAGYAEGPINVVLECGTKEVQAVFVTFFAFGYIVPLTAIACFSMGILRHITKHKTPTVVNRGSSSSGSTVGVANRSADKKRKAGRMLILITILFAILWLPVHIHLLFYAFDMVPDNTPYDAVSPLWNCLAYFNSCVNPIIYNRTSAEFRNAFRDVAHCRGTSGVHSASGREERIDGEHVQGNGRLSKKHNASETGATIVPQSDKYAVKLVNIPEQNSGAVEGNGCSNARKDGSDSASAQLV